MKQEMKLALRKDISQHFVHEWGVYLGFTAQR